MSAAAKQDIRGWKALKPMPRGGRHDHCCCEIDDHRIIIVGGLDAYENILSSGMIYDARTELWTPLPNDMPEPLYSFGIAGNDKYVFVIGGMANRGLSKAVYRLSLETYEWTTMAPMGTARWRLAAVRKGDCIYVFGGVGKFSSLRSVERILFAGFCLRSVERYTIVDNAWEPLPDMKEGRCEHCAVAGSGRDIYIVGGVYTDDSFEIFDSASLLWKTAGTPCKIPGKAYTVAALLKDQYLAVIGGFNKDVNVTADCLIYDTWSKHWSVTPSSVYLLSPRHSFIAVVQDNKIVVAGGVDGQDQVLSSTEYIGIDNLLEYAPLHYPLPLLVFDRILEIGKGDDDRGDTADADEAPRKKAKIVQSNS